MRYQSVTTIPPNIVRFTTIPCPECSSRTTIDVPVEEVEAWKQGAMMQVAFRSLDAEQRERMMTGMCGKCWDELFGEDEDND